ncbi:MarR family winged helix-turn-helix transcriptional regulator [Kibdelosporangium phytohabitans]|uniref:MarR family transcriptional regulator n=1 Tax=Kibdelosporangium phytohabitans TaxID=860235 RepID=A0A0N9I3N4_9PSEU|nr:MarR family winged helix-turn-helix transcriptional regulator [Kibdelosporangium phytohabitans]ALG10274.1 MarR family transcriptional regulator [Kibdelosporangium phytohabitans]MBE1461304.1 DNA-binding MarR family transcriptional regulator [Kibdelosporangium phytohabitans]
MADQRLYFLLQRAAHQMRLVADRLCVNSAGITTAQLGALFAVQERPGITQQELAHTLGQRESAITAMVSRLVEAGLITKRTHPRQYRAIALDLTPVGRKALDKVRPVIDKFNEEMRAVIGAGTFDATAEAMAKLDRWFTANEPG